MDKTADNLLRLAKFLSTSGIASRRAAGDIVKAGRVCINGVIVNEPGVKVNPGDTVTVDGTPVKALERLYYIMLNKPRGYTCSNSDPHAELLAVDLIKLPEKVRLFSAGRLDRDSEGMIIFSNDGDFVARLTHPRYETEKIYMIRTDGVIPGAAQEQICAGINDEGELLRARSIETTGKNQYRITLNEGKKREIRRLTAAVGILTVRLKRVQIGCLRLGDLPQGEWRELTPAEVELIKKP